MKPPYVQLLVIEVISEDIVKKEEHLIEGPQKIRLQPLLYHKLLMKAIDHVAEPCRGTMRGEHMAVIKEAIHHQCAEYLKGLKNNFHLLKLILKIAETWLPLPQESDCTSNAGGIEKSNTNNDSKTLARNLKNSMLPQMCIFSHHSTQPTSTAFSCLQWGL